MITYQEREALKDETRKAGREWFCQLMRKFGVEGWTRIPRRGDEPGYWDDVLFEASKDGETLSLWLRSDGTEWTASMRCPQDPTGSGQTDWRDLRAVGYNERAPHAAGKAGRNVAHVFADIMRRVVEPSKPLYDKARATITERGSNRAELQTLALAVIELAADSWALKELPDRLKRDSRIDVTARNKLDWTAQISCGGSLEFKATISLTTLRRFVEIMRGVNES